VDIIVVDNASTDATHDIVASYDTRLNIRYLYEPTKGTYGKSHALNKALGAAGGLGEIIAVLDDDMSVREDWFRGVASICARWPDMDMFSGKCYVVWPSEEMPEWVFDPIIQVFLFSAFDSGDKDQPMPSGQWLLGGCFWFRSRVLVNNNKFEDAWLTEPLFMLQLVEQGYGGVSGPDAVVGHRIQPGLLNEDIAMRRAAKIGIEVAEVRLKPYRKSVRTARLFKDYPVIARMFCIAKILQWYCLRMFNTQVNKLRGGSFGKVFNSVKELAYYKTLLHIAGESDEYRCI
jgi:glycosyltransferase involved in cell wall biosynthesis